MINRGINQESRGSSTTEALIFTCAVLLILLFGYTALSKAIDFDRSVFQMRLSPSTIVSEWAFSLGWLLPFAELVIVALLAIERWRIAGLYGSFLLLASFQVYIGSMLVSGMKLPCACGGIISKLSWTGHLWLNWLFMTLAAIAIILTYRPYLIKYLNISLVRKRI